MPDIRDFLPQPPWEGPPVPKAWTQASNTKRELVAEIDKMHMTSLREVGSVTAIMARDIDRYEKIKRQFSRFKTAADAKTGEPITILDAVRVGGKLGIFYSDVPLRVFGNIQTIEFRDLVFENPVVFKDQWDAIEKLFGEPECSRLTSEYEGIINEAGINIFSTLVEQVQNPSVFNFWNRVDSKIISEVKHRGYDGIVYHHGRERLHGEYVYFK